PTTFHSFRPTSCHCSPSRRTEHNLSLDTTSRARPLPGLSRWDGVCAPERHLLRRSSPPGSPRWGKEGWPLFLVQKPSLHRGKPGGGIQRVQSGLIITTAAGGRFAAASTVSGTGEGHARCLRRAPDFMMTTPRQGGGTEEVRNGRAG